MLIALVHGASHADDLFYYFKSIYVNPPGISSVEFELVKTMVELITSFAISGTPKISEETVWNVAFDSDDPPMVMNIANSKISMIPMPEFNNIKVFNKIFESASVDLI